MKKEIAKQIETLKNMSATISTNTGEQIEALKLHYGVKKQKDIYQCLQNEIDNGIFAALSKIS